MSTLCGTLKHLDIKFLIAIPSSLCPQTTTADSKSHQNQHYLVKC